MNDKGRGAQDADAGLRGGGCVQGYSPISDYGIIGNLHTVALVGLDGSIDWLCLPHIDSASVFSAILDRDAGGRFCVAPAAPHREWDSTAHYLPGTNILVTRFRTSTGLLTLTDFMPIPFGGEEEMEEESHELYRLVEMTEGRADVAVVFDPRFDYARVEPVFDASGDVVTARGGKEAMTLCCTRDISDCVGGGEAVMALEQGERVWLRLHYGEDACEPLDPERAEAAMAELEEYWKSWLSKSETGRRVDLGPYGEMVERSALALKLLYYGPAGTIAAAATASLPEVVGGERNWDYRFTWVRDSAFTLEALFNLGHLSETEGYLRWIEGLLARCGCERLQAVYGLGGEADIREEELDHLEGYRGSKPVRVGNGAMDQVQLDIYGELMDAALKLADYVGKIDSGLWPPLRGMCDYVCGHWREKDSGIWEVRGGPYHFVYSKVMCWVALDRGVEIARRYGFPADKEKWERTKAEIKGEVLDRGWSREKEAFVQHYETDALDASALRIPLVGFLPHDDPRVVSTLEAVRAELADGHFVYRYRNDDELSGSEGAFLICSFWLIENLIAQGRLDEAATYLGRVEGAANHLGLFSEEYDLEWREQLGNFPQAFTHIGYINSVISLRRARGALADRAAEPERAAPSTHLLLSPCIMLNDGEPTISIPPGEIAGRLKKSMNTLRGAFYDTESGRVAYEKMRGSAAYADYLDLSRSLKQMDLGGLGSREEKIAFWVNLYNVIVIHGIIELGVRDSIKEVRNFFKRTCYSIGGMEFSPDAIEHGILRGNSRPPNALFRPFGRNDARLAHIIEPVDARIHFTLVCASLSCPPIAFYSADKLDEQLTLAGQSFVNGGGAVIDRDAATVSLSRIFKWYAPDFGGGRAERLRFIAGFVYDDSDREYLIENAERVRVLYQSYDWRLNKG